MVDAGTGVESAGGKVRHTALHAFLCALALGVAPGFAVAGETTTDAPATVRLVGSKPGRPPLERLLVEVTVRNVGTSSRWALVPTNLPRTAGSIDKLEQLAASSGATSIAIGRFLGAGGRYAILLAPAAQVTLRNLEVQWWREQGVKEVAFDIEFADEVTLAAKSMAPESMAQWFDRDPTVSGVVETDMQSARHVASHRAPGDKGVAVTVSGFSHVTVQLAPP